MEKAIDQEDKRKMERSHWWQVYVHIVLSILLTVSSVHAAELLLVRFGSEAQLYEPGILSHEPKSMTGMQHRTNGSFGHIYAKRNYVQVER